MSCDFTIKSLLAGFGMLVLLSACDNEIDPVFEHKKYVQDQKKAFAETFTEMFGEIPADQSWDFSKYGTGSETRGTRAGGVTFPTPDAPSAEGWYYVPEALTAYITQQLPEDTSNPKIIDNSTAVSISLPKGSFTIYPIYQGRAQSWDIFMQVGDTHYPVFRKSSNIERSSDGNIWQPLGAQWETVYNTAYSGDTNNFYQLGDFKPGMTKGVIYYDYQYTNNTWTQFRIAEGVDLKAGSYVVAIKANTNKSGGFNCPLQIKDWSHQDDSSFEIKTSVNLAYDGSYNRKYSTVQITVTKDGRYDFALQPGDENCAIQVESVNIVKPGYYPANLFSDNIYSGTSYTDNKWLGSVDIASGMTYNPYESYYGPGHMFVQNFKNVPDNVDPTNTMGYKVRTKGYTFNLSGTHNESDKINFYALITSVPYHYQNTSVGTRQSSISKQMKFIKVPDNISLNDNRGGVNFDGKTVYIIGLEDADYASNGGNKGSWSNTFNRSTSLADGKGTLENSDYDYNDLIMIVAFDEEPEIKPWTEEDEIETKVQKRYMVEDLGATDDIDFNDMVVDVIQTTTQRVRRTIVNGVVTNTENVGSPIVSQKAIIRAMGGTLDFDFKIGGNVVFTKSTSQYTVGTMYNTTRDHINYSNVMWEGTVSGWNPTANNVSFTVYNKNSPGNGSSDGVGTSSYDIVFPGLGEVPYIIAFDPSKEWRDERHPICKKWLAGEEPAQWEWPEPHDKEGDMTYEKWKELYGNNSSN